MPELRQILDDIATALVVLDGSGKPCKNFQPGVGPYGEPQLIHFVAECLKQIKAYGVVKTKRTPDLLISGQWAFEFKIARPFGDNGKEAENWSVNLLHPYEGNVSLIGDCLKLSRFEGPERRAVVVIGYEHTPPRISLAPLLDAFEVIARMITQIDLGKRIQITRSSLCHPVHQQLLVVGWEVLGRIKGPAPGRADGNSPARS